MINELTLVSQRNQKYNVHIVACIWNLPQELRNPPKSDLVHRSVYDFPDIFQNGPMVHIRTASKCRVQLICPATVAKGLRSHELAFAQWWADNLVPLMTNYKKYHINFGMWSMKPLNCSLPTTARHTLYDKPEIYQATLKNSGVADSWSFHLYDIVDMKVNERT